MSKKKEKKDPVQETPVAPEEEILEEQSEPVQEAEPQADAAVEEPEGAPEETGPSAEEALIPKEQFLRLAAEYDNYRKRTAREKENLWFLRRTAERYRRA